MKPIIEPATAETAKTIKLGQGLFTISAGKLASAETVTFQLDEDDVVTLGDLYQDGSIRQLTATHNVMTIQGPIDLQVTKSVTAAAVGVYLKG